jgi:hypothetical protein
LNRSEKAQRPPGTRGSGTGHRNLPGMPGRFRRQGARTSRGQSGVGTIGRAPGRGDEKGLGISACGSTLAPTASGRDRGYSSRPNRGIGYQKGTTRRLPWVPPRFPPNRSGLPPTTVSVAA